MTRPTVKLVVEPPNDAGRILQAWTWLLPDLIAPVAVNRFGDWYLAVPDGSIHLLSIWEGTFQQVARSHDEWRAWLATDEGMKTNWCELVLLLYDQGRVLAADQCFAFVPPPLDGIGIDVDRIRPYLIAAITPVMGQTHAQRAAR